MLWRSEGWNAENRETKEEFGSWATELSLWDKLRATFETPEPFKSQSDPHHPNMKIKPFPNYELEANSSPLSGMLSNRLKSLTRKVKSHFVLPNELIRLVEVATDPISGFLLVIGTWYQHLRHKTPFVHSYDARQTPLLNLYAWNSFQKTSKQV